MRDQINETEFVSSDEGTRRKEKGDMTNGIRVVLMMNRKGGSGKSTLCRALASAAVARGETVSQVIL